MTVVYPDASLIWLLLQIAATTPGLTYHLYGNPAVVSPSTKLSDLVGMDTVFPPIVVPQSLFSLQQVTADVGSIQAPNINWTNLSGVVQTVYGFFATDGTGAILVQVGQFDGAPISVPNNGVIPLTPTLGGYSANAS